MIDTGYDAASVLAGRMDEMTPSKAVTLVRQLCAQLGQDAESFHGNICPTNIRQDWDGQWVLGEASDAPVAERNADQVEYVAPEFFWDNIGNAAGDVYSLGMLLYALCDRGYLPFQPKGGALTDKDRSGALRKRMKGEPVTAPSGVSSLLKYIVEKALSYEPENRYLSAAALLEALNETDEALPEPEETVVPVAETPDQTEPEEVELEETETEEAEPEEAESEDVEPEEIDLEEVEPEETESEEAEPEATEPEEVLPAETEPENVEEISQPEPVEEPIEGPEEESIEEPIPEPVEEPIEEPVPEPVPEEPSAVSEKDDDFWNMPLTEEPTQEVRAVKQPTKEKKYTVQKDFEGKKSKTKASPKAPQKMAAPASKRKPAKQTKKNSWVIPALCVLAVVIVVGAVYGLLKQGSKPATEEETQVSEPFVVTPATVAPEATESPEPEDAETPEEDEEQATEAEEEEETRRGSATIGDYTVEEADDTVYVNGSGVNLRSGPSTTYPIETTLSRGVALERTGTVNGWSQVQYEGEEYYVSDALVTTTKPEGTSDGDTSTTSSTSTNTNTTTGGTTNNTTTATTTTAANTTTATNTTNTTTTTTTTGTTSTGSSTTTTTATTTVTATRDVVVVSKNDCYLRSGPGTGYTHVATLDSGAVLQRTGTVNGWSRVVYEGQELYISDTLIGEENESTVTTAVGTVKVTGDVNVRSQASTDGEILGVAKTGESLTITGLVAGKWYRVSYDGQEGYVNRNYIQVRDFALVAEKSGTVTVQEKANIRSGASTDYEVLTVADAGESLTITGLTDSNWYQVSYNDQTGYIAANLVKAD